ncbi:MAG TPA: CtsR family transcriptional regulator [Synergistaceae bacterium]|nr:CtsR family transcriptional regulator [Synergistaceae bacterium]HQH78892.1 CtsR family transcriptional regulator [Synergistaceae bacterium]HQK25933.1 CtsR family transcriptional regulator [Synergistaceae bacterium]
MSSLTKLIEAYIEDLLEEQEDPDLSLRRKELAARFGCVPSQINYVLSSRFTPERGYIVESQRGGHGFIRIMKVRVKSAEERLENLENLVGESLSERDSRRLLAYLHEKGVISSRERLLVDVALRHQEELARQEFDVSPYRREVLQADLLKRLLRSVILA